MHFRRGFLGKCFHWEELPSTLISSTSVRLHAGLPSWQSLGKQGLETSTSGHSLLSLLLKYTRSQQAFVAAESALGSPFVSLRTLGSRKTKGHTSVSAKCLLSLQLTHSLWKALNGVSSHEWSSYRTDFNAAPLLSPLVINGAKKVPIALWKHLACSKAELHSCPSSNSSHSHFSDTSQLEEPFSSNHSLTPRTCKNPASFFLWTTCNLYPCSFSAAPQFLNLLLHSGISHTTPLLSLLTHQTPKSPLLQPIAVSPCCADISLRKGKPTPAPEIAATFTKRGMKTYFMLICLKEQLMLSVLSTYTKVQIFSADLLVSEFTTALSVGLLGGVL